MPGKGITDCAMLTGQKFEEEVASSDAIELLDDLFVRSSSEFELFVSGSFNAVVFFIWKGFLKRFFDGNEPVVLNLGSYGICSALEDLQTCLIDEGLNS